MTVFKPKTEILPQNQRDIWPKLKPFSEKGFVLYGGTAVALYLGHRESVDFDFFSPDEIAPDIIKSFPVLQTATLIQQEDNALTYLVPGKPGTEPVKISLFWGLEFAKTGSIKTTEDGVLRVAPLKNLLATKLKVIFDRIETKDYIDIATILEAGVDLNKGLNLAQKFFGAAFSPNVAKKTLVYFDPPELKGLEPKIKNRLIAAVKKTEFE